MPWIPELKHEVISVLEDLKRDGLTLIVVTHEMGFARRAADRVVVLAEGQIVEEGSAAQVLEQPAIARTRQFLQQIPGLAPPALDEPCPNTSKLSRRLPGGRKPSRSPGP